MGFLRLNSLFMPFYMGRDSLTGFFDRPCASNQGVTMPSWLSVHVS